MSGIKDQEQIDALRKRLYERGSDIRPVERHQLPPPPVSVPVATQWSDVAPAPTTPTEDWRPAVTTVDHDPVTQQEELPDGELEQSTPPRRRYRIVVVLVSLLVFIIGAGISSVYLFFGANQISADNIGLTLSGPSTLGGGEVFRLQVGINNQNPVPLESATLIVRYPNGTRSLDNPPRQLFEERIPLDTLPAGEIRTLTLESAVFAEENTEHTIEALVEYRVSGSNSLFERRAEPLAYRISTSPVGLRLSVAKETAPGQELPMTITVQSNSPTELTNVLIRAEYPSTFSFLRANPAPVGGQNVWLIEKIPPNGSVPIELRGILNGFTDDVYQLRFVAGVPRTEGSFELGGQLAQVVEPVSISQANIGIRITANGATENPAIVRDGQPAQIAVTFTNTQSQPLREVRVSAKLTGTMLANSAVTSATGRYEAAAKEVTWQALGEGDLVVVSPGESRTVTFLVSPETVPQSGSFTTEVTVVARRDTTDVTLGTGSLTVQYPGRMTLRREVAYGTGVFPTSGPVPPRVNEATTYVISLAASAGSNRISGAVVTANLPRYVSWLDQSTGPGTVEYNQSSRQIRWVVGDVEATETAILSFPVRFIPSADQEDDTPALLQEAVLQANDTYTGTLERVAAPFLTTELSSELGFPADNGRVRQNSL
jgi:hypothetical protein